MMLTQPTGIVKLVGHIVAVGWLLGGVERVENVENGCLPHQDAANRFPHVFHVGWQDVENMLSTSSTFSTHSTFSTRFLFSLSLSLSSLLLLSRSSAAGWP